MAQVQDFSAADLRLVPTLLWDVVADSLHPAEREEVRSYILRIATRQALPRIESYDAALTGMCGTAALQPC